MQTLRREEQAKQGANSKTLKISYICQKRGSCNLFSNAEIPEMESAAVLHNPALGVLDSRACPKAISV